MFFVSIYDSCSSASWYWFIAADSPDWQRMPIVAWYNGGPGSSSLFGWFQEGISPYFVKADLTLGDGEYAWTRFANIICVDNPIGVGFSYTGSGAYRTSEEQIGAIVGELCEYDHDYVFQLARAIEAHHGITATAKGE